MNITEKRQVSSLELDFLSKSINVCWVNSVLKDGEVIAMSNERRSFNQDDKEAFSEEIGKDAKKYISLIW